MQLSLSGGGEGGHQKVGTFVVNSGEGHTCHCPHEHLPVPAGGSRISTPHPPPLKTWDALQPWLRFSGLQQIELLQPLPPERKARGRLALIEEEVPSLTAT